MNQFITYVKTGLFLVCLFITGQMTAQISNNSITSAQQICKTATPSLFQGSVPTGGSGNYTYQWQQSNSSAIDGFTDIVGANDTNYQSIALDTTTWFRRIAIDGTTADSSTAVEVTVYPNPIADAIVNNNAQCLNGNSLVLKDSSSISTGTFKLLWSFGDGATDTLSSTSHTYSAEGSYHASLVVTSDKGCIDSTGTTVKIFASPIAKIGTIANSTQCLNGNSFDLIDSSSISSGTYKVTWNFGDGATDTTAAPKHSYAADGNYTIKLMITSDNNCMSEDSIAIIVNPSPKADAKINSDKQCLNGNNFIAYDSSSISSGTYKILWNFGDGYTDTLAIASHSYSSAGNYDASLIITSDKGCIDSTNGTLSVNASPEAYIGTIANSTQCFKGNNFDIKDSSNISSGTYTLLWSFGDGSTDTIAAPSHSYSVEGNYTIKLTITSDNNCISEDSIDVTVNPSPIANAHINQDEQCFKGNNFIATDSSSISSGTYTLAWDFGDGYTDTLAVSSHSYSSIGSYKGLLVVTSDKGCVDSSGGTLSVNASPVAAISYIANTTQCLNGNLYSFFDSSSLSIGSYTREWNMGDASTDTAYSINYNYKNDGDYNLRLVVTTDSGCVDTAMVKISINPSPKANAGVNSATQCFNGNKFVLTDSSSISAGTYTRLWDFGDGFTDTSATSGHSYTTAGVFHASLTVTSDKGCIDTLSGNFTVNASPTVMYNYISNTTQCLNGNSFNFGDSSSIASGSYTRLWNFGDGNTDTSASINGYSYKADGTYEVKLYITSDLGCIDSTSIKIIVNPSPKVNGSINNDAQCFNGNSFVASDSTTISSGSYTRVWNFGDGYSDTSAVATHSYSSYGVYNGSLIVTSDLGCIDSIGGSLTVYPSPSVRSVITGGPQCLKGNNYIYYDSSVIASGSYKVLWNFGDGMTDTLNSTTHSYNTYGKFYATLIVTSDMGCVDSLVDSVEVNPHPVANASMNSLIQCFKGNSFTAYDSTTIATGNYTRVWDFGDGNTDTSSIAIHSYAKPGIYTGSLIVTSDKGCIDSIGAQIIVDESPVAVLNVSATNACFNGHSIDFTDSSYITSGNVSSIIYFGDNDSSTTSPANHVYSSTGNYLAYVVTVSKNGCTDTAKVSIDIDENPKAGFSINNNGQCLNGNSFDLTNSTSISAGSTTYAWDFGDSKADTATNPTHSYAKDGGYTIQLIATSDKGCTDTTKLGVDVYPSPVAKWNVNNATQCLNGNSFSFSDSTMISFGSIVKLNWDFANGTVDSVNTKPVVVYTSAGNYQVILKATSDKGCTSNYGSQIVVNANPMATNIASGATVICIGKTVDLKTISGTGFIYQWLKNGSVISGAKDSVYNVSATGNYRAFVTNAAGCSDTSSAVSVTVNNKSNFGSITGVTAVTSNATYAYMVALTSGVTYNWAVTGGTIQSGQGTNAIQVKWGNAGTGKIVLTADCYNSDSVSINIVNGIGEVSNPIADIYPNPTQGNIYITLPTAGYEFIQLFDLSGKSVITKGINGQSQLALDMSELAAGVYQVVITGPAGNIHQKVVLNK